MPINVGRCRQMSCSTAPSLSVGLLQKVAGKETNLSLCSPEWQINL